MEARGSRLWGRFTAGVTTLVSFAVMLALALADYYDAVPIGPMLSYIFGDAVSAKAMVFLPVIFATIRWLATGHVRLWNNKHDHSLDPCNSQEPF